ncbi:MAG: hypothetical protein GY860_25600 [Desulfobacteraceae bacterium]|nr:hypothetical protein [Desulfobacteraceae bacterium]
MNNDKNKITAKTDEDKHMMAEAGISFFCKMSASATHEIKNTLAIINENAGLLEDLSMMAEKGHPLALERVKDISQRVAKQVGRADLVLKKLNRLSHSVDLTREIINLENTVKFVLDLAARIIEMQGGIVEITSPKSPIMVDTNLFYLQNLIWRAIDLACCSSNCSSECLDKKKHVIISFGTENIPLIRFSMDRVKAGSMDDLFCSKEDRALMASLKISIEKNEENNWFGFMWKKNI